MTLSRGDWQPLINGIEMRLDGWKGTSVSQGGRLVLVNSVRTLLPLHYISYYRLPLWVIRKIDQIKRSFLWKGVSLAHVGNSLISWETVCSPKRNGGWGVLNLFTFKKALGHMVLEDLPTTETTLGGVNELQLLWRPKEIMGPNHSQHGEMFSFLARSP